MTLQPFTKEQVNFFKFAHIVTNEFPKALRQSFKHLWDTTYGHRPGYRFWDDSKEVREMFLREEGGITDVPTNLSYTKWDCSTLFQATLYSQSFSEEDSEGRKTSLSEKYVKPHRLAKGELLTSIGKSSTSVTETFTIAINQLRILRNNLFHLTKAEIDTKTFGSYIQLSEKAFGFLNVATASIKAISSYSEDDFPTEKARKIREDIMRYMEAELRYIKNEILKESLHITKERNKELLESIIETFGNREKVLQELVELIKSEKSLSRSKIGEVKDSTSLEEVFSVLKGKQQTEEQRGEDRSESSEETLDENQATSPSTIYIGKSSTSLEEVFSALVDKQRTEEQSGEDESELFKETHSVGPGASPSDTGDFKPTSEKFSVTEHEKLWLLTLKKGEMLLSNYGAKTFLENQVKQLRDDVNDKLEYVGTLLVSIASVLREEKKLDQQLIEGETKLTEDTSGERLFSNYGAKTSLENQVKQLHDDVNDKLEYVRAALMSIASVVRDEKKPIQQLIEGETKLTEDTSSERLEKSLSRSKIGEVKDSTSLEEVSSVLKSKQQTEEQRGEYESESFKETLDENQATSPSTIYKGKDSTSLEEVISVPVDKQQTEEQSGEDESELFKETHSVGPEKSLSHSKIGEVKDPTSLEEVTSVPNDKQQTEEQSGEDESESFEETLGENQAISPSAIDKGKDPASLEEVISVPMDKQQTEEQSGEDESESFEITLSVGPATSPSTIDKGKDSTSLEEVISVPVDKQQTEGQSGEDESELFKETLRMGSEMESDDRRHLDVSPTLKAKLLELLESKKLPLEELAQALYIHDTSPYATVADLVNQYESRNQALTLEKWKFIFKKLHLSKEFEDLLAVDQSVMMIGPTAVGEVNCSGSLPAEKSLQGTQPSQDLVEPRGVPLQDKPFLCVNVLPELNTNMTLEPFNKEQVNYFKFANIVVNEFPKALRQSFEHLWNTTYGQKPGYRIWDDSEEVRKMFLHEEGGTTDVPTDLSYTEWDCSNLFRATIFSQSFSEEDSTGWKTSLSEKYIKSRPDRLAEDELLTSGKSGTSVTKPFSIAINQLRTLRNTLLRLPKAEIDTKEFETYIQLSEEAFGILNVATASIRDISSYSEDDFPTKRARKIKEDIMNDMRAELKFLAEEERGRSGKLMEMWNLQFGRMERTEGLLKRMLATLKERKEGLYQLLELIESGLRLLSDYAVQPSLRYQVKQLRDDVNAKLEKVRPSLVSVASVLEDKKKLDQQPIEGGTKLPEDASSESLETSLFRLRIDEVKDSTSLEKVTSVLKDKQQTEKQSEDESESFEETLSGNQATSPSTIDKGKDSTLHEEVISVPVDNQQTEKQSGEDESESFEETLSVGPGAQDHDIKGKTTTFEAEHKECIRVLPYTNASGRVYVQLYVFCDKNGIPKELKADAQEFFGETGFELRWTNLYNYASNIPNIVSVDFKQLEVSQVNDVSKIINKNLHVFSKHRNITAIQPSLKETNSKQTNDPCIRVYVLGKGRVPLGESEIPNSVEDCPVDIVDGFWCETLGTLKPLTAHRQEKYLRLGASIGATNFSGTLGAILKDNDDGLYLLSCDHVIKHEVGGKVTHPGSHHYLNSIGYHMTDYQSWIDRIFEPIIGFHPQLGNDFMQLRGAVNSACNYLGLLLHPKLIDCENIILKLLSEPPRTVAEYVGGIREDVEFLGKPFYLDVAIAKLTKEEEEALKKNGFVEIVDTTNYPDGNVTMGESQSEWREWFKSGSYTGCTSLKSSFFHGKAFLMNSEHERPSLLSRSFVIPREKADDDLWRRDCILFPHNDNLFSYFGDSGAVIFEKSEQHPQAMPGFCIVIGGLFSNNRCVATIAVPLGVALEKLSEGLGSRLTLVSKLKTPSGHIYGFLIHFTLTARISLKL